MDRRLLVVFMCALAAAGCIGYLAYRAVNVRAAAPQAIATQRIVVATRNLEVGSLIVASDLKMAPWSGPPPKNSMAKEETALNRGVVAAIYEGEAVLGERLATAGSGAGLAALIPPGMRACAIKVDEVVGVSGFVTPGMRVDILIAGVPPGASNAGETRVKTLMQNIQVLSAGANLQKDNEGKAEQVQVVNLLVTPDQAETLSLASNQTHIQLVLRNPVDTRLSAPPGADVSQLFGVIAKATPAVVVTKRETPRWVFPSPVAAPLEKPLPLPLHVIEVLNGATRTEARFDHSKDPK